MADPLDRLDRWNQECRARFEMGRARYGDSTFRKDPVAIIDEALDELRDTQNYVFATSHALLEMRAELVELLDSARALREEARSAG